MSEQEPTTAELLETHRYTAQQFVNKIDSLLLDYGDSVFLIRGSDSFLSYRSRKAGESRTPEMTITTTFGDVNLFVQGIFRKDKPLPTITNNVTRTSFSIIMRGLGFGNSVDIIFDVNGNVDMNNLPNVEALDSGLDLPIIYVPFMKKKST